MEDEVPHTHDTWESRSPPGSWNFSVRTPRGRVIVCVPNTLLCSCFGARSEDESFRVFAAQMPLLHQAALIHLEQGFAQHVEIDERDVALALTRSH